MPAPLPDFDPYELLGLDASADAATVDRAYKARIRHVHPDIAGVTGLDETKRLNVAREWLLDAELRARLPKPSPRWGAFRRGPATEARPWAATEPPPHPASGASPPTAPPRPSRPPRPPAAGDTEWYWAGEAAPPPRPAWDYDPETDDPITFDYGDAGAALRSFFGTMRRLSPDERARVTHCLGEEPPLIFEDFEAIVGERLWAGSRALADAVELVWRERHDEVPPLLFPRGRVFGNGVVVANAYAQWSLLGDAISKGLPDPRSVASLERRCTAPWLASVGHERYGARQVEVVAFLDQARRLTLNAAERLSRAWQRDMGSFLYGRPGEDWFPSSVEPIRPDLVSARLAAVDASRIEPPEQMRLEDRNAFRCGLRLTGYALALEQPGEPGRDWLRPWKEALDPEPSFADRARWGLPRG